MYLQYFGLNEAPFSITPDPRFVFMSVRHDDAMAHLMYGITEGGGGGFVQLTGEVGTGKTTLCRCLIEQLPDSVQVALILNPKLEPLELLETICEELGISTRAARGSQKKLTDRLNRFLLKAHGEGRHVVLILDEAQNLSPQALEQVRLLTNLETATKKLLQMVLLGQPELRDLLARPDLRQLAQRITARFHLGPLDRTETADYLGHRLKVAGVAENLFTASGCRTIHRKSGGVPRVINIIAERCLVAAYARGLRRIDGQLVALAAAEVLAPAPSAQRLHPAWLLPVAAGLPMALLIGSAVWWQRSSTPAPVQMGNTLPNIIDSQPVIPAAPAEPETPAIKLQSFGEAWEQLLKERALASTPAADSGCPPRMENGMVCIEGRADARRLRQLGRPILARFSARRDEYAVLEFGDDAVAQISPEGRRWHAPAQVMSLWSGAYIDLYQRPGYLPDILREGDRGPGVLWIKSVAAHARPRYQADTADPYFGPALRLWAQDFQRRNGLIDDGLIGRETVQLLSQFHPERAPEG